jgi:site-specific DNA-methyltransferase (adenine-specific)/adenine-specific DNA-methyltransferase
MPTLDWFGKKAVVNHHNEVPFHLLRCNLELSVGEDSGNLLVQGDNLLALKALLPYYAGQVKCIYIDPPYNTGDESWVYNDAVNSPERQDWLGKVVGREAEDLSRHDKWLCIMYPRLALIREFIREDGVLFVSIDENEIAHLRLILNEVFGKKNEMGSLVWKRRSSSAMSGTPLSIDHEYVLVYAKNIDAVTLYGLEKGIDTYRYEDEKGVYASTDLTVGLNKDARPGQYYTIINPRTGKVYEPNPERVWRFYPETMQKVIEADLIIWPDEQPDGNMQRPRYKTYYDPKTTKPKPVSSWIETSSINDRLLEADEVEYEITILTTGMNQEGGKLIQKIIGSKVFACPKPLSLVRSLIRAATRSNDLVLDSFAGTGTTGHAVLDLNTEDGGKRRFILVELDVGTAQSITAERLRRVIQGYTYRDQKGNEKFKPGLGGGFRYCELGPTLFDAAGHIRSDVTYQDLARHVFFTETGQPPFNGPKVIYGDGCLVGGERLRQLGVVFKQIPYQIRAG